MADLKKYYQMQKRIDLLNMDKELHFEIVFIDMPEDDLVTIFYKDEQIIMSIKDYDIRLQEDEEANNIKKVINLE